MFLNKVRKSTCRQETEALTTISVAFFLFKGRLGGVAYKYILTNLASASPIKESLINICTSVLDSFPSIIQAASTQNDRRSLEQPNAVLIHYAKVVQESLEALTKIMVRSCLYFEAD